MIAVFWHMIFLFIFCGKNCSFWHSIFSGFRKAKMDHLLGSFETFALYSSPYANIGGYCVGLLAGVAYNELKARNAEISKVCYIF